MRADIITLLNNLVHEVECAQARASAKGDWSGFLTNRTKLIITAAEQIDAQYVVQASACPQTEQQP